MKRKWLVAGLVVCMMGSMVACGKVNVAATNEKEVTESVEKIEDKADDVQEDAEENDDKTDVMRENTESDVSENDENKVTEMADAGLDELEAIVMGDVEGTIAALTREYEALLTELDTYETYVENTDTMEAFYEKVYGETRDACIRLREYCVTYANVILESDKSFDEKYEDFELMYDCVYEDAADEIYDQIYEGFLDEVYDEIYDGLLDDARENAEYAEWLDARSNEYEWWLDCRSDVYEEWLDCRSDIYEFWLDVRGEMWDGDEERAYEKIEDFIEDIEKLKSK